MKLTICITTYNRPASLLRALVSVANQSNVEFEVIVVDDASTEPVTLQNLPSFGCNLRVINHRVNRGLAVSRNTAISMANGEFFSFCDDDDEWSPGLASRLVCAMENAPPDVSMALAYSDKFNSVFYECFENYPHLTSLMMAGFTPPVGSQIYRTEILQNLGGYRPEVLSGVDHDLWVTLARIDPRVAIAWGHPAVVCSSPSHERMTTIEKRRRLGIENSLTIWRYDLSLVFGPLFYKHFVDSYRRYLDYNFFLKSIQKREYFDAFTRALRSPWLVINLVKRRLNRLGGRLRLNTFPKFKGR